MLPNLIVVVLLCNLCHAILVPNQPIVNNNNNNLTTTQQDAAKELDTNSSFYYEADSYLINKNETSKTTKTKSDKVSPPASLSMTSARNGRMLDLDALVGDFAASQANKERIQSGNRQSRFLPSSQHLDLGKGKKLHIQGFIPIVGVKDEDSPDSNDSSDNKQSNNELPYAQSSIGHASFGVQRYLNSDPIPQSMDLSMQQSQQVDAKYSGATSMVDTLKKPIKKLASFASIGNDQSGVQSQNCLCVPFYMCKNGYVSESSLGKTQIQQMLMQQQLQMRQNQKAADQSLELKSGLTVMPPQRAGIVESVPLQHAIIQANQYPAIDERSLDREIVTAPPESLANHTVDFSVEATLAGEIQEAQRPASDSLKMQNMTDLGSNDYSQDILGRMLGLKSTPKVSQSQATGVCGLLRTCCNIPAHLFPSQQDLANERLMAHYGQTKVTQQQVNKIHNPTSDLVAQQQQQQQQQQQAVALQRYMQNQQQKVPYGFPTQISRSQSFQPLNTFSGSSDAMLAHRSNQYSAQPASPYNRAAQQMAQYTRSVGPMQPLQSFQPQQQQQQQLYSQVNKMPQPSTALSQQQAPMMVNYPAQQQSFVSHQQPLAPASMMGTRKILDGRCGLRQSAGITGRVQNLQYHESSADFGEYPGQVAILKRLSGSDNLFVCGGALISQYWVATAAHCIKKHSQNDLKVRLGEWDVHRDDEFYPYVEKDIRDVIIHPDFVAGNLVNDIALLRLDSPIDPSLPHVNPACLPTIDESFNKQRCWVTGWGKDSFGQKGSFQAVLREVELPVVGHDECESALKTTRLGPHYRLHSGFVCAGGEGGRDACEGDGGSGLYCYQDGVIKVAGLVSWGIGCGQAGVPGVYVNMAYYRPWIENIISIDEDIYSSYSNMVGSSLISERSNQNSTAENPTITSTTTTPEPVVAA